MRILEIERISVFWCSFPLVIPLEYLCLCFLLLYATTTSHINLIARTGFVTGGHYGLSTGRETSATLFPSCRSSCTPRFPLCPLTSSWFHLDLTDLSNVLLHQFRTLQLLKFDRARGVATVDFQTGDRHHYTHWNFFKMKVLRSKRIVLIFQLLPSLISQSLETRILGNGKDDVGATDSHRFLRNETLKRTSEWNKTVNGSLFDQHPDFYFWRSKIFRRKQINYQNETCRCFVISKGRCLVPKETEF